MPTLCANGSRPKWPPSPCAKCTMASHQPQVSSVIAGSAAAPPFGRQSKVWDSSRQLPSARSFLAVASMAQRSERTIRPPRRVGRVEVVEAAVDAGPSRRTRRLG